MHALPSVFPTLRAMATEKSVARERAKRQGPVPVHRALMEKAEPLSSNSQEDSL